MIKAKEAIIKQLNKNLDNMNKLGKVLAKQKREMRKSESNKFLKELEILEGLAKKFDIYDDVKNLAEIVEAKVKELERV